MDENSLIDCGKINGVFDERELKGHLKINDILQKPFEKFIGNFEIPSSLKDILDADRVNAVIAWYYEWKLVEHPDRQNTCTIKEIFGYYEGINVIIAINLYKYLRNKGYDPEVVEKFLNKQ